MRIPDSAIHYTVSKFHTSDFTRGYHYGELMAVPTIQKPRLSDKSEVRQLLDDYFENLGEKLKEYARLHASEEEERKAA